MNLTEFLAGVEQGPYGPLLAGVLRKEQHRRWLLEDFTRMMQRRKRAQARPERWFARYLMLRLRSLRASEPLCQLLFGPPAHAHRLVVAALGTSRARVVGDELVNKLWLRCQEKPLGDLQKVHENASSFLHAAARYEKYVRTVLRSWASRLTQPAEVLLGAHARDLDAQLAARGVVQQAALNEVERSERRQTLIRALATLRPADRLILRLCYGLEPAPSWEEFAWFTWHDPFDPSAIKFPLKEHEDPATCVPGHPWQAVQHLARWPHRRAAYQARLARSLLKLVGTGPGARVARGEVRQFLDGDLQAPGCVSRVRNSLLDWATQAAPLTQFQVGLVLGRSRSAIAQRLCRVLPRMRQLIETCER